MDVRLTCVRSLYRNLKVIISDVEINRIGITCLLDADCSFLGCTQWLEITTLGVSRKIPSAIYTTILGRLTGNHSKRSQRGSRGDLHRIKDIERAGRKSFAV